MSQDIDAAGNVWELRRLSSIDTNFHPVRNPPEFRDLYGKFYNPEVWVITGKVLGGQRHRLSTDEGVE